MKSHEFAKKISALPDKPVRIWTGDQAENCDFSLNAEGEFLEIMIFAKDPHAIPDAIERPE